MRVLAVVDGKVRIRQWQALRDVGHWSNVIALYAQSTPPRPASSTGTELVTGSERVDLAEGRRSAASGQRARAA